LIGLCGVLAASTGLFPESPGDPPLASTTLKLINQSDAPRSFVLAVSGVDGIELDGVADAVLVEGGGVLSLPVRARAHRDSAYGINTIHFSATATDDPSISVQEDSRFLGPTP